MRVVRARGGISGSPTKSSGAPSARVGRPDPADAGSMRRRILDSASRLLVDVGYADLSMRKLASVIGYSATTIYLHFDSKDALFHALVEEGMERLRDYLRDALDPEAEPFEQLEALCEAYIRFGLENSEYYEIMFVVHPASVNRFPADKYRRARTNLDLFASALASLDGKGSAVTDEARVEATAVWATLHGTVSLLNADRVDLAVDRRKLVDATVRRAIDATRFQSVA